MNSHKVLSGSALANQKEARLESKSSNRRKRSNKKGGFHYFTTALLLALPLVGSNLSRAEYFSG